MFLGMTHDTDTPCLDPTLPIQAEARAAAARPDSHS